MNEINVVSLFSGCGGLDLGFEAAEFKIHFSADILEPACQTLRKMWQNTYVYGPPKDSGDILTLSADIIYKKTGLVPGQVDVLIGGPPCQSFSMAAAQRFLKGDINFKRKGYDCEKNGSLIFEYLRLVKELRPKIFLMENVPGIIEIDNGKTYSNLCEMYNIIGYKLQKPILLDAADYGVPQKRRRVFLIGSTSSIEFKMPNGDYGDNLFAKYPFNTVAQALVGLTPDTPNNESRSHKSSSIERYKTLNIGEREKLGRVDRLDPKKPSKTVIAGGSNGGGRSHLHPYIARTLSVRESARLQTFPDHYIFEGKNGRQFTQVGNAVPPFLAEQIARQIAKQYFNRNYKSTNLKLTPNYPSKETANNILREEAVRLYLKDCYNDVKNPTKRMSSDTYEGYVALAD